MKHKRNLPLSRLYVVLAICGGLFLLVWPQLATAMPLTAQHNLERAWRIAADAGHFDYQATVRQTTHPTPRLENAGRQPTTQRFSVEGLVDQSNETMQMRLWSSDVGRDGIELKFEDGQAFGRLDSGTEWQEIPNPTDLFAPGGDPLGFLIAAENVEEVEIGKREAGVSEFPPNSPDLTPQASTRYTFDINGPRYAAYMRKQVDRTLREQGELPPSMQIGLVKQYIEMTGYGEIWLNDEGLPIRQIIHLEFPPEAHALDWIEADITSEFGSWESGIRSGELGIGNQGITALIPKLQFLSPNPQTLFPSLGLGLLLIAFFLIASTHYRSPLFYGGVVALVILSMLVMPLLQSHQVQAFTTRQTAKQTEFEQQRQSNQAPSTLSGQGMRAGYNPTVNPLASSPADDHRWGQTYANPQAPNPKPQALSPNRQTCDLSNLSADCDGDSLSNGVEIVKLGTSPTKADSDGDNISDKTEVAGFTQNGRTWYLDPLNPDSNGDFLPDGLECPQRQDIDSTTGQINPDITPGTCTNSDGDSAPDVFDYDDDNDDVPDNVDLARLSKSKQFNSEGNDLAFNLKLNGNGQPVFVDFQLRPPDVDHLYLSGNVLDWPANDTAGQMRRIFDTTFAETPGYEGVYRADQGDMVLNPLLEFEISFDPSNPSAGLPITSTMSSADITSFNDLSWLDTDALAQVGASVNEGGDNTLLLWLPLTYVQDELAGDSRVAWQARMMYEPELGQTILGNDQTVRLIWMIEALTDNCSPPAGTDYDEYCADTANWTTSNSIIQTYYEAFTLTGLQVREDHGLQTAIIADPSGGSYGGDLWQMADSLETGLIRGELKAANSRFSVADIPGYASSWGMGGLDITTLSYDTQLGLGNIASGESVAILNRVFSGATSGDSVSLLIAGEEQARLVTLGDTNNQWSGNLLRPDLSSDLAWLNTNTSLRWAPYVYQGADVWEAQNLESYFDVLESDLTALFSNSELNNLLPSENITDYSRARDGVIMLAQSYYQSMYIGLVGLVAVDGELASDTLLADYSLGNDEPVTRIMREMLTEMQSYYGEISQVQTLNNIVDETNLAASALSRIFANSRAAILEALGDVAQGNASNILSLTLQKLEDYYKTTPIDSTDFTKSASFVTIAYASVAASQAEIHQGIAVGFSAAKIVIALSTINFGLQVMNGSAAAAQASAKTGLAAGQNVAANSVTYLWNSAAFWAVAVFVLTVTATWVFFAISKYDNPLARSPALARAIAATIVAMIVLAITLIPVVGVLISAIIGLIDGLALLICAIVGVEGGSDIDIWVCGGLTGAATTAIAYLLFDQYVLVDLGADDRLDMAMTTPAFVQTTANPGPIVGNELAIQATVTTTLSFGKPSGKLTRQDMDNILPGRSLSRRQKEAAFGYYLQNTKTNHHQSLSADSLSWDDNREVFNINLQEPLTEAGINAKTPVEYLTESFNVPYIECWYALAWFVCEDGDYKDSVHTYLGEEFRVDIFPASFDEFVNLTSTGNQSYRLDWDSKFPTLIDADGDGLRSQASGGPDPDDSTWDFDNDGLSDFWELDKGFDPLTADGDNDGIYDYWEAFHGTNPRLADSDNDGLTDGDEIFHSQSRNAYQPDNQSWLGGWDITYTAANGDSTQARVFANPLDYDSDDDSISDKLEQVYGYNPNLPSVLNILSLDSAVEANAVQSGQSIGYTATIKNELDGRVMNGLLQAELPVDVVQSTEVMDTLQPLQSVTMVGAVNAPVVAQSTVASLTIRAGVVISGGTQATVQTVPGPVFYLDEFNSNPSSGYNALDDSGNNHNVSCSSSGLRCANGGTGFVNDGFDFSNKGRLSVSGQNSLKLGANDNSFSMAMWINPQQGYSPDDLQFEVIGRTVLGNNFYNNPNTAFPSLTLKDGGNQAKAMMHFGHGNGQGYCLAESGNILDYGQWQHLAVSFDGAQFSYYVNGTLADTQSGTNCTGQSLYPAKNFTIGHSGGLSLRFKQLRNLESADNDEGYIWSDDNRYQNGSWFNWALNPYNSRSLIWRSSENAIDGSGPLNLTGDFESFDNERWAVNGQSSLTYWLCNRDGAFSSDGCLDSDNNSDEPILWEQNNSPVFERTHSQLTPAGQYTAGYNLTAGQPFPINKWAGDLTYNIYNHDFNGKLDEIGLYNTNLSADDVEQLYFTGLRVADLNFDEPPGQSRFADASASNATATCSGATCPDSGIPGRDNQALRFDGVNDYVDFPMPLDPTAQQFTAAAWFKADNTSGNNRILQQRDGAGTGRAWLGVVNGKLQSFLGGTALNSGDNTVQAGQWHHAAVTSDGATVRLYLDGVQVASANRNVEASDGGLRIGAGKGGPTDSPFDGLIDEVIIQRGALNATGVQRLMTEAPLLNLHLDEDLNTTTFVDDSPYRNDATCLNGACPDTGIKGQIREAAIFNALDGNDNLSVDISNTGFRQSNYSVAFWLRPEMEKNGTQFLLKLGPYDSLYIPANTSKINAHFLPCGSGTIDRTTANLPLNKWSHFVFTANQDAAQSDGSYPITLYVNGAAALTYQAKNPLCAVTTSLDIGSGFNGDLDEFAIYGKALRDDEVRDLYDYQAAWYDQTYAHQIIIDVDDPQVSLGLETNHLPLANTLLSINAIDISTAVSRVQVTLTEPGGGSSTVEAVQSDDPKAKSWFYSFEPTVAGQYTIDLLATDVAGNSSSSSKSFYVDNTPPSATLDGSLTADIFRTTAPSGNGPSTFSLFGSIGDAGTGSPAGVNGDGIAVELFDWRGVAVQGFQAASDTSGNWQVDYPFAQPAYGQYQLRLNAADAVGNVYSATLGTIALNDLPPTGDISLSSESITSTTILHGAATTIPYPSQNKRLSLHFDSAEFSDAARNHLTLSCTACPTAEQSGQYGQAALFNGSQSLSVQADINPISETFTVLAWFNPSANNGALLSQSGGDDWLALNSGRLSSSLGGGPINGPTPLSTSNWHHAALSFDGALVQLYLNGTLEMTATRSVASNEGDLLIGSGFSGLLDDLVVYDTVLNAEKIYDIANPLDTGLTSAQIRFRHLKDADQGENEGDWLDVTLTAPGQNYSTWTLDPPNDLEGPYKLDLKVSNDLGLSNFMPNIWQGSVDMLAPRLTFTYARLSETLVRTECYAYDYHITATNWLCPAGEPIPLPETADWYVESFSTTAHTTAYALPLQTVFTTANTLQACDSYGYCATLTGDTAILPEAVAILTPSQTLVITGLVPVTLAGYGHSENNIDRIMLTANGKNIFNQTYGSAITETTFATTWTPPAWGTYTIKAWLTNGLGQSVSDPVQTEVQVNAPQLNISKQVTPTLLTLTQPLSFTVMVRNTGNLTATNVRVTDTLASPLSGTDLDETITLAPGERISYTLGATYPPGTLYVMNTAWFSHTWERKSSEVGVFRCDRFEVFNPADSGLGTLRHAIDTTCGESLITFASDMTIQLKSTLNIENKAITIDGLGHSVTIKSENTPSVQLVKVANTSAVTLSNLILAGRTSAYAAAVRNLGTLNVLSSTVRNSGWRGAILHESTQALNINGSYFHNNRGRSGGALYLTGSGPVTISHSLFRNNENRLYDGGGAIYNNGSPLSILNSTFTGNKDKSNGKGGAIAIYSGETQIIHSTFSQNAISSRILAVGNGADIYDASADSILIANSIFANPSRGDNCQTDGNGSLTVVNSLIESGNCGGTFTVDPQLTPLADNGGNTATFGLLPGSPALDAANPAYCPSDDQRNQPRPSGPACDLGAFESLGFRLETSGSGQTTALDTSFSQPLVLTLYANGSSTPLQSNLPITLTGPISGAGLNPVSFNSNLSNGQISAVVTANALPGTYVVTATMPSIAPATFVLTNTAADLVITKTLLTVPPVAGQFITYTLAFSNEGEATASNVIIRDTLPPEMTVQEVISSGDVAIIQTETGAVFETAPILPGERGIITLTGLLDSDLSIATSIVNQVEIESSATEVVTDNNQASVTGAANCFAVSRLYVDADATGSDTGLSWADAHPTLQDALGAAQRCGFAEEIWVAEGAYYPDEGDGKSDNDRFVSFNLQNGLALYGGFNGTETDLSQRDISANVTVLSGDLPQNDTSNGDGVVMDASNIFGKNSYNGVVRATGVNETAILDGFTITAGRGQSGGLRAENSSLTLRNLTFQGNQARTGGGLYGENSVLSLSDSTFAGNRVNYGWGAGMYLRDDSSATLERVRFEGNTAVSVSQGGGLYVYQSAVTMTNSLFSGNSATNDNGGGLYLTESEATLNSVSFGGNYAQSSGAGMTLVVNSSAELSNVILWGNGGSAQVSKDGSSTISLDHSLVQNGCPSGATCSNLLSDDPLFANLPTTMPDQNGDLRLLPGSAAIDAGTNTGAPAEDIRGVARPLNSISDMGAYESQGFTLSYGNGSGQTAVLDAQFAQALSVTLSSAFGDPVGPGGQVSFVGPSTGAGPSDSLLTSISSASGVVSTFVTANSTAGTYTITATAQAVNGQATFALTNTVAEIQLRKSVTPLEAAPGDVVTYTLAFTNNSAASVAGLVITDFLSNISVLDVISGGDVVITRTVSSQTAEVFETSAVLAGDGGVITLTAQLDKPLAVGLLQNTATLTSTSLSGAGPLVSAEVMVLNVGPVITGTTLTIAESEADGTTIGAVTSHDDNGDSLSYNIISGNPNDAFALNGTDLVVNNSRVLDYETLTQHLLTVQASDGTLTATTVVTINLNNTDADLALSKAAKSTLAYDWWNNPPTDYQGIPGDLITYTLTVDNIGDDDASGVVITDAWPIEVTLLSLTASIPITQTGSNPLQWEMADIFAGQSGVITLTGRVDSGLGLTVFTNTTGVSTAITDSDPSNNNALVETYTCAHAIEVDNDASDEPGSLAWATYDACDDATITFSRDMTITLSYTAGANINPLALDLFKGVTIDGGAHNIILKGDPAAQDWGEPFFRIETSKPVTLSNLTLVAANGSSIDADGSNFGGTVDVRVISTTITGNTKGGEGGATAIYMFDGALRLINSSIISNVGDGLYLRNSTAEIVNSTIANNTANTANGLSVQKGSVVTVTHSTIVGNGGLNDFERNGNIEMISFGADPSNRVLLQHSLVGGGINNGISGDQDCFINSGDELIDAGYNLLGSNCPIVATTTQQIDSSRVLSDVLTPWGDYGGTTPTFALRPNSPALDGGSADTCLVSTDQRGLSRPFGPACDIGAVESRGYTLAISGGNEQGTLVNTAFAAPLQVTLSSADSGVPVGGYVITFTAPAVGASVTTATFTATTDVNGIASIPVVANDSLGSYAITASLPGLPAMLFTLSNAVSDADLAVSKTVTPSTALPGEAITYTLSFENKGAGLATGVVLTDLVPNKFSVISSQWSGDAGVSLTPTPGLTYEWAISDLAFGQSGLITLTGTLSEALTAGSFTNTASITTSAIDADTGNNQSEAGVGVLNLAPELAPLEAIVVTGTTNITYSLVTTDVNGDSLDFSLIGASEGMTLSQAGLFSWQPPAVGYDANYTVTVQVSDGFVAVTDTLDIWVLYINQPPTMAPIATQSITEGQTISFTVAFSDAGTLTENLNLDWNNVPTGASVDDTGHFIWPTTESDDGVYTLTLTVSDGELSTSQDITLLVTEQNEAPSVTAIAPQMVMEGQTISFTATATDTDIPAQSLTFSLSDLPAGASFSDGNFIWATTEADDGIYTPTLHLSDGVVTSSQTITLTVSEVNQAPVLTALGDWAINEGEVVSFTATASDSDLPAQTLSYSLSEAPFGAVISATGGGFYWQSDDTHGGGVYNVTVLVSDGVLTDSQSFNITVDEVNQAPVFATQLAPRFIAEGDTLSVNAIASDVDVPQQNLTYSLNNAPAGMSISDLGRVTWTTSENDGPSAHAVTINVSDGELSTSQTLAITVTEVNTAPVFAPLNDVSVSEGQSINFSLVATDTDVPAQTLRYHFESDTPISATLDSAGQFTWPTIETDGGEVYGLTLHVSDGVVTSSQTIALTVTEINNAPVLAPLSDRTVGERSLVGITAVATDTDSPAQNLTFSLGQAPPTAEIGATSGGFTWLTTVNDGPGVYSATILVSDSLITTSQSLVITVTDQNEAPYILPIADKVITETSTLTFNIPIEDDPNQFFSYRLSEAPPMAHINDDGDFRWPTVEGDGPASYTMTVAVSDGLITSTQVFTVRVLDAATPLMHSLTMSVIGQGSVSPGTSTHPSGTTVNLVATPDSGWQFVGWTGAVTSLLTETTLLMDTDKVITATFSQIITETPEISYTLTTNVVGSGTISPTEGLYLSGTVVSLDAMPDAGWRFDAWSGDMTSSLTETSLLMDADKVITATFSEIPPQSPTQLYLPLILNKYSPPRSGPDLVVENLIATSNAITVVVKNLGLDPVVNEFWLQVVLDVAPTGVNQRWDTFSSEGALWGVVSPAIPLAPTETRTLTLNDAYYYDGASAGDIANNIPRPIPAGTIIYAQVDAINHTTTYGNVLENDETNNINSTIATARTAWEVPSAANKVSFESLPRLAK